MADERSSWRLSLQLPSLKEIAKRLSGHGETDELNNDIVRYRGISVRALADICARVQSGAAAEGVELLVAEEQLADDVPRGHTLRRTGADTGVPTFQKKTVSFRAHQVRAKARADWTVQDVCSYFVLPLALPRRCIFLDLLSEEDYGRPFEGVFVSQWRQYKFAELVDTLLANEDIEFVWFDIFCANQVLMSDKDASAALKEEYWDKLRTGFYESIARFQEVVLVFDSWKDPAPFKRGWCVWEMYITALKNARLRIVFAGSEAASVELWLHDYREGTQFLHTLADMTPRAMQCHDPVDLQMIREGIEAIDGGFSRLKQMVTERLTPWLLRAVEDCVKSAAARDHDESFASLLHNAAMVIQDVGELDVALSYYRKALAIKKEALGERHLAVTNTLNNMASVYQAQGKLHLALQMYEEDLSITKEKLGERNSSVAQTLNNMGVVFTEQAKLDLALETFEAALAMRKEALGPRDFSVAETLNNMANVYDLQGKLDLALETYREVLEVMKEVRGERHFVVAQTLGNMANVYMKQGSLDLALATCEEALAIKKEMLGEQHSSVADTLVNMAGVYGTQGNLDLALATYGKALAIYKETLGERHTSVAVTLSNMAKVYALEGQVKLASVMYHEALSIYIEVYGELATQTQDVRRAIRDLNAALATTCCCLVVCCPVVSIAAVGMACLQACHGCARNKNGVESS